MGKSVRINISLPEETLQVYRTMSERTGVTVPQVLVNALAYQAAYALKWVKVWDFQPRDQVTEKLVMVDSPSDVEGLTRQQRRQLERQQRKQRE